MEFVTKKLIFLLILLAICTAMSSTENDMVSLVSKKLDEAAANENFSGAILFAKREEVLLKKAYGMANRQYRIPNTVESKFNMASEGKLFTSLAIAQLVDKGKCNLSDKVAKYLPEWIEDKAVTIQDLLVHTSGLGSFFDDPEFKLTGSSGRYIQVKDYKVFIERDKPRFRPGTNQLYSNNGYILLGALIERLSGENYFEYLQKHIFDAIGMENTGFYEMDEVIPNLAIGFGREMQDNRVIWKNNLFTNVFKGSPAGGCFSTINDMFKFVLALQENKLLSKEMTARFLSGRIVAPDAKFYKKEITVHGQKFTIVFSDFGPAGLWNEFGLEIYSETPLSLGHNGGGMRGIDNDCVIWPEDGTILLYFSNYTGDGLYYPGPQIKELLQVGFKPRK